MSVLRIAGALGWWVALAQLGCADEVQLAPVSDFRPEDCSDPSAPECRDPNPRVPIRGQDGADGGLGDGGGFDGSFDGGEADAGFDAGPPDLGPPPSVFLDLEGTWDTEYVFDVSSYLFGISRLGAGLDFVDQALRGNLDLGNSVLNTIVRPLLDPFIRQAVSTPNGQRFATVIGSLNTIAHLFEEVEATGQMVLVQDPPSDPFADSVRLSGTERWDALYLRLIAGCPEGRRTTSPPHPLAYPACANVAVPIQNVPTPIQTGSGEVDVQVYVAPFEGWLAAGVPEAPFQLEDRVVELELTKLILLAMDLTVRLVSGNEFLGLEDLFRRTICFEVAEEAERLALGSSTTRPFAQLARRSAEAQCVRLLVDRFVQETVGRIGVSFDAFEFDQDGYAVDRTGDGRPEQLQRHATPDTLRGRFRFVAGTRLGGTWQAP